MLVFHRIGFVGELNEYLINLFYWGSEYHTVCTKAFKIIDCE